MTRPLTHRQMQRAFAARDRSQDGRFVVGVTSTGIYCRPSCPARRPRPEHLLFLPDSAAAEARGLRACKRCAPDRIADDEAAVTRALALLDAAEERIALADLARSVGYSPGHLQRLFQRATGLSPAAYARERRQQRARGALSAGKSVTEAIHEAGYGAPSRFYEHSKWRMGMTPGNWRDGGRGRVIHWARIETSLAPMLVAATERGVCCLAFDEGEGDLRARFPNAELVAAGESLRALFEQVTAAVEKPGAATGADIPLDVQGTAFQQRVWQALREIPPGETRSYAEIAAALGNPKASRAVGGANGANHVAVLIPCHRVIAADGGLGGYAYGTAIKAELLRREADPDEG